MRRAPCGGESSLASSDSLLSVLKMEKQSPPNVSARNASTHKPSSAHTKARPQNSARFGHARTAPRSASWLSRARCDSSSPTTTSQRSSKRRPSTPFHNGSPTGSTTTRKRRKTTNAAPPSIVRCAFAHGRPQQDRAVARHHHQHARVQKVPGHSQQHGGTRNGRAARHPPTPKRPHHAPLIGWRLEEHTSELQSLRHFVCRL